MVYPEIAGYSWFAGYHVMVAARTQRPWMALTWLIIGATGGPCLFFCTFRLIRSASGWPLGSFSGNWVGIILAALPVFALWMWRRQYFAERFHDAVP